MTCADTQGRWPRPTLPPGAPVGEAADADRCLLAGEQGAGALGVPPAALTRAVHPPHPHSSGQRGGGPFSPLVISPSSTGPSPQAAL